MVYGRFWGGAFRINLYAAGISWFHEAYLQYSMRKKPSMNDVDNPQKTDLMYESAEKAFREMGADLERHPLKLTTMKSPHSELSEEKCSSAIFYKNLITGAYCLQVDPEAFNHFKKRRTSQDIPLEDYYRAVFSHEAVHAIENHNFLKLYCSALVALSAVHLCEAVGMRLAWLCVVGPVLLLSGSGYVGQKLELRADRLAAEQNPSIRKSLISILSDKAHDHGAEFSADSFLKFFHDHPSMAIRLEAIKTYSADSTAFSRLS